MDKIINLLINNWTKGVDTYTHNGSTWLIFTEQKSWVIELTESKTLWYNYNFFKELFSLTSMDVVDNQHYITKWVEDNIINKELTYVTLFRDARDRKQQFEDTLENGVKETRLEVNITEGEVDDIIQDGVKHTKMAHMKTDWSVEDTIENGVKETLNTEYMLTSMIEDTIQNGVKETLKLECCEYTGDVDEVLENGVKETQFNSYENKSWVEGVIKKGVKETKSDDFNVSQFLCEEVIDKGIKETKISPTHTEYGDWLDGDERLDEIIRDGVKETNHVDVMKFFDNKMEDTLEKGVKSSIPRQYVGENIIDKIIDKGVIETHDDVYHHKGRIDGVIKNGVKETHREICEYKKTIDYIIKTGIKETKGDSSQNPMGKVGKVIDNGVKETKTPGEGDIVSTVEWMKENKSNSYTKMIDDVIENGVKETVAAGYTDPKTSILHIKWGDQIDDVIDNGVKEVVSYDEHKRGPVNTFGYIDDIIKEGEKINGTYVGGKRQKENIDSVIGYGTKNPSV